MSFTMWLAFFYVILIGLAVLAFAQKNKAVGLGILIVMAISITVLAYMWVTSPM